MPSDSNRCFKFQKRSQLLIRTHDETPSVVARQSNPFRYTISGDAPNRLRPCGNVIETHEHADDFKEP